MPRFTISRRRLLAQLTGSAAAVIGASPVVARVMTKTPSAVRLSDGVLTIEFDSGLHSRI